MLFRSNNSGLWHDNSGGVGSADNRGSGETSLVGWNVGDWGDVSWSNLSLSGSGSWHWDRGDRELNAVKDLELWRVVDVAIAVINLQVVGALRNVGLWGPNVVGATKVLYKCVN